MIAKVAAVTLIFTASLFRSELAQPSQHWARDWRARNLDATLALYTDDAVFLDVGGSHFDGKPALRKFFATVLKQYSAKPVLHSLGNGMSGDLAYDWGEYSEVITPGANPGGSIQTHGTYRVILRRVSGHWLIAKQIWTGSTPVPVRK